MKYDWRNIDEIGLCLSTESFAVAEGPRDALCQLNTCQMLHCTIARGCVQGHLTSLNLGK